ncbi:MAG: sialic acid TRAP transporter substrate-binding protein SiaP [Alphaproteobacteria bacterium]|nr:sialic acid TRAP transporter substrate-binding protein SiaP [Alphaproteobacteria bacterium]
MRSTWKFALAAATLLAAVEAQAQTALKWAHVYETSEPYHRYSVWAAQEIGKRTNGKFKIDVFPASQLGKESDLNQGLQLGTIDILISGASFAARAYPPIGVSYYPFTFRDADHLLKYAKSDVFKELTEGYRKATGNQVLAVTYYGARHVTANKSITKPEDMKGLKIRVPDVPAYMALPKATGANPTPIAFAEVYLALQTGTVEAQENPLPTIEAKKFYEVQKFIILTAHIVDSLNTTVGGHVWGKLSDAEKKIFQDVMQEAAAKSTEEIKASEVRLVGEFRQKGIQVLEVDRKPFLDAVLKSVTVDSMGYRKADWDRIQAIK